MDSRAASAAASAAAATKLVQLACRAMEREKKRREMFAMDLRILLLVHELEEDKQREAMQQTVVVPHAHVPGLGNPCAAVIVGREMMPHPQE